MYLEKKKENICNMLSEIINLRKRRFIRAFNTIAFLWKKKEKKKQAFLYLKTFAIAPCGEIYRIVDFHPFICEHRKRILRKRCLVLGPNFPDPKCYNLEPQRTVYRHADSFRRHRRTEKSIAHSALSIR